VPGGVGTALPSGTSLGTDPPAVVEAGGAESPGRVGVPAGSGAGAGREDVASGGGGGGGGGGGAVVFTGGATPGCVVSPNAQPSVPPSCGCVLAALWLLYVQDVLPGDACQ